MREWPEPSIPCALNRDLFVNRGRRVQTPPVGSPVWVKGKWDEAEAYARPVRREEVVMNEAERELMEEIEPAVEMMREAASDDRVSVPTLRRWALIGITRAAAATSWVEMEIHARMAADLLRRAVSREAEEAVAADHPMETDGTRLCTSCRRPIWKGSLVVVVEGGFCHRVCRSAAREGKD